MSATRFGSGRKQCPASPADESVYWSAALIRSGASCAMPTARATASAVLKPMPHTSFARRYGSFLTTPMEASPYFL